MNKRLIDVAVGREKADLVIKNSKVVDVFLHKIIICDVAVSGGKIAGLGNYSGNTEIDAGGQYLMPSLIDSHVHIESSMLVPSEFAKIVAQNGVTTIIADPHEIVNVCGENGIKFMIDDARNVPIDIHYMLPSCVPATEFDSSGCEISGDDTKRLMQKYNFLGLGEMMNYPAVVGGVDEVLKKIDTSTIVDGHAPMLSGKELNAYICSGIKTDHECSTVDEMFEKISKGMYVQIREGTQSKNLADLVKGITVHTMRRILFCTDDRYLGDVLESGSISNCIRKAVSLGVDPIDAITIATLNVAECYGLLGKGAIAPGYVADFLLSKELTLDNITNVYKDGKCIAKDGKAVFSCGQADDFAVTNTVHIDEVSSDYFDLEFKSGMTVIEVFENSLITKKKVAQTSVGLNLCAVVERHHKTGNIGKCFVDGVGLKNGAIAQTIGHDSHNITVVGDNPHDMAVAVNALAGHGGMCVVKDGKVIALFKLPIAGLMTDLSATDALEEHKKILNAVKKIEDKSEVDAFMMLSFLSLLVIPECKLSDKGLFDVLAWKLI